MSNIQTGAERMPHSFPTRRSSDLDRYAAPGARCRTGRAALAQSQGAARSGDDLPEVPGQGTRSEEHTSELQSQSNLVCRLLLEKIKVRLVVLLPFQLLRLSLATPS